MKKFIALFFVLILSLNLISCGNATQTGDTQKDVEYPLPVEKIYTESNSLTELSYDMTLWDYTLAFNSMYMSLGGGSLEGIELKDWVLTEKAKKDENGVVYDCYYYNNGKIVLTATVETDTEMVLNLGCGTTMAQFTSDHSLRLEILTVCGIMAAVAGGYDSNAVTFFDNLFVDTIDSDDHCFWYEKGIYLLSYEERESVDESTLLFRTMPASANIRDKWNLKDYRDYWKK